MTDKPEDTLDITLNGETKTLFMSAGLLRILCNIITLQDDMTCIFVDANVQEQCLLEVLAERTPQGTPTKECKDLTLMAYDLNSEEAMNIVKWMGDHTLHFFTSGTELVAKAVPASVEKMNAVAASLDGLKVSAT